MPETIRLLGSTKSKITKDQNVPHLEITKVVLVHCNTFNNEYQHDSRFICCQYIVWSIILTFNVNVSYIKVWFTGQNPKSLEVEDKINIALVIN